MEACSPRWEQLELTIYESPNLWPQSVPKCVLLACEILTHIQACAGQFIEQIWIYGDETRDYLIAFVVLTQWSIDKNFKKLDKTAKVKKEIDETRLNEFKFKQLVYEDILRIAEQEQLSSFEKPRQLHLTRQPFTPEKGFLTPALTLRRANAKVLYTEDIEKIYV